MNWSKDVFTYVLACAVVGATFALFYHILIIEVEQSNKDIIIYILGILSSVVVQIINYFFGSSKSSRDKTEAMHKLLNKEDQP